MRIYFWGSLENSSSERKKGLAEVHEVLTASLIDQAQEGIRSLSLFFEFLPVFSSLSQLRSNACQARSE